MTTAVRLLEELESLTHRERMRHMVRLGQAWVSGDASAGALLDALWGSGRTYERTLALQSVYGSRGRAEAGRDVARVVEAATAASRTLRFRAMRLVATVCDDVAAGEVLRRTSSRNARARLLSMLQRRGRRGAVAVLLEMPGVLDEPRNVDLLPLAPRALVVREMHDGEEAELILGEVRAVLGRRETASAVLEALRPPAYGPPWRGRLARRVLGELAKDPRSVVPRIDFAGFVLSAHELVKLFEEVEADGLLHVDATTAAFASVNRCASPSAVEELLRNARFDAAGLRRIALHALVAEASSRGWTRERRELLEAYRQDGAMIVASAAAWVFPPSI
jgi:hypothetical protein